MIGKSLRLEFGSVCSRHFRFENLCWSFLSQTSLIMLLCRGSGGWSPPREGPAAKRGLPPVQLYDLVADPRETTNLQAQHPELVKQLTAALRSVIEAGRSTPGSPQQNHGGRRWWKGLPWKKP